MHALQICAVVFSFISLLLLLIALGSDYWVSTTGLNTGLWRACIENLCGPIGNNSGKLNAVRAFMLIGMIAGAVSFFGLCATSCKSQLGSISLTTIAAVASFAAGLCTMIAMSIYTAEVSNYYGWSFALGWATFPLYLIICGLAYKSEAIASE